MPKIKSSTKKTVNVGGRHGRWTDEQLHLIESVHLPRWHRYAFVENKDAAGSARSRQKLLTSWKQEEAEAILQKPEFSILPEGMSYLNAREALLRKFTNYHNNQKRTTGLDPTAEMISAMKISASALIDMKSQMRGRDLFRQQMEPDIMARRAEILSEAPGLSPIAAYQKALKELWDRADPAVWEKEANVNSEDIYRNQARFAEHLHTSMRSLCRVGSVGPLELLTLYAYRDEEGRAVSGILEAHHTDHVPSFLAVEGLDREKVELLFEKWALGVLPEAAPPTTPHEPEYRIPRNTLGIPVFPSLNLASEGPEAVRRVINAYLTHLWNFCRPMNNPASIPWEEIQLEPNSFYDCEIYQIEDLLGDPAILSIGSLYALATEFSQHSNAGSPKPFQFHCANQTDSTSIQRLSSPHLDNLIRMSPSSPLSTSSPPPLPNSTQAIEEPGIVSLDDNIYIDSTSQASVNIVRSPIETDHSRLTSREHSSLELNVDHHGDEAGGLPLILDKVEGDTNPTLKSPPRHIQPPPSPPLSDLTPPPDAPEDVVPSDSEIAGQFLHEDTCTNPRSAKHRTTRTTNAAASQRRTSRRRNGSSVATGETKSNSGSNGGQEGADRVVKGAVKGRKRRIDDVELTDGRRGKLRRVKKWEGGYFVAHGDSASTEEWKDEKDVAKNYGMLDAE